MFKKIIAVFLCSYLAGCSLQQTTPDSPPPVTSWEAQQQRLTAIKHWDISGKIGIRTEQNSQSASLKWLQKDKNYQIDIRGPWGQGGASITGQPGNVIVGIAGEGTFTGPDPEYILQQKLNWQLPISDIYWWIRGLPAPDKTFQPRFINHRLQRLIQSGWEIHYLGYNTLTPALPRKMRLTRQDLRVTLVINHWGLD